MKDGLYQVTTRYLCGGFVVKAGQVVKCAPILRKRLDYWRTIAVWVKERSHEEETISVPRL